MAWLMTPSRPKPAKAGSGDDSAGDELTLGGRLYAYGGADGPATGAWAAGLDGGELLFASAEEPASFKEVEQEECWRRAMEAEMQSIKDLESC